MATLLFLSLASFPASHEVIFRRSVLLCERILMILLHNSCIMEGATHIFSGASEKQLMFSSCSHHCDMWCVASLISSLCSSQGFISPPHSIRISDAKRQDFVLIPLNDSAFIMISLTVLVLLRKHQIIVLNCIIP